MAILPAERPWLSQRAAQFRDLGALALLPRATGDSGGGYDGGQLVAQATPSLVNTSK